MLIYGRKGEDYKIYQVLSHLRSYLILRTVLCRGEHQGSERTSDFPKFTARKVTLWALGLLFFLGHHTSAPSPLVLVSGQGKTFWGGNQEEAC